VDNESSEKEWTTDGPPFPTTDPSAKSLIMVI